MLKPDPDVNPNKDAAWFGILTWIQPVGEVRKGRPRMVRISSLGHYSLLTLTCIGRDLVGI